MMHPVVTAACQHGLPSTRYFVTQARPANFSDLSRLSRRIFSTGARRWLEWEHPDFSYIPTYQPAVDDDPPLNAEQRAVVNLILSGKNVFYTGAAGTGKSRILREVLKKSDDLCRVSVVAPTGKAAHNIGGMTTWAFMGWSPAAHATPLKGLQKKALMNRFVRDRLRKTDLLIIDEISMVENHHLERLNSVMKWVRHPGNYKPAHSSTAFGGCQVVVTGDFFQLPPVQPFKNCIKCGVEMEDDDPPDRQYGQRYECPQCNSEWFDSQKWAFHSDAWEEAAFEHVELKTIHRQAKDQRFMSILNTLRVGQPPSAVDTNLLMSLDRQSKTENAVRLYPTRREVAWHNDRKFQQIDKRPIRFIARDKFDWNTIAHPWLEKKNEIIKIQGHSFLKALRDHRFEPIVDIKKGMVVMLLANLNTELGLVNGSQGVVTDFKDINPDDLPAEATSVGESQANPQQAALESRDMTLRRTIEIQKISEYMKTQNIMQIPIVKFDKYPNPVPIYPNCCITELGREAESVHHAQKNGHLDLPKEAPSQLCRIQLPLMAGWAMSVHRAQGMTLEKVVVDLSRAFEAGQVYVALSRATALEGLKVYGNRGGLTVGAGGNKEVIGFYNKNFGRRQRFWRREQREFLSLPVKEDKAPARQDDEYTFPGSDQKRPPPSPGSSSCRSSPRKKKSTNIIDEDGGWEF